MWEPSLYHDMRSALTVILGYADLLSQQEESRDYASRISALGSEMVGMVANLQRGNGHNQQSSLTQVNLRELIRCCALDTAPHCRSKGLALHAPIPENVEIITDRQKLRRILQNVLDNAVRYTEEGEIRLDVTVTASHVMFTVRDTGIGISPDDLDRVFRKSYRGQQAREMVPHGSGLGLAIVRQFARSLGGGVRASSTPGQGSTFTVTIRRTQPRAQRPMSHKPYVTVAVSTHHPDNAIAGDQLPLTSC